MDPLTEYFTASGDKPSRIARRIGRAASTITRALAGQRNASTSLALDVERVTNGGIKAGDFLAACLNAQRAKANS